MCVCDVGWCLCVCVCVRERERVCVWDVMWGGVCVCVCERERESVCLGCGVVSVCVVRLSMCVCFDILAVQTET